MKAFWDLFETTDETADGHIKEYVGCKVKQNEPQVFLTQPVKIL